MSKQHNLANLNGSSDSIIIKNDSNLDISTNQTDSEVLDNYDLEVQKPAERAKILSNKAFFKKLSYSFYSESLQSSKSLSSLPKLHYMDSTASIDSKKPKHSTHSEPISQTTLNNLDTGRRIEERLNSELGKQQNELKTLKIKNLQNFHFPTEESPGKAKPSSPSKGSRSRASPKKLSESMEPASKVVAQVGKLSLKQDNKSNVSAINLDKHLKHENKSPPTAKISLNIQTVGKTTHLRANENTHQTERLMTSERSLNMTVNKVTSPKTTKILLPCNDVKREEKTIPKTLKNNIIDSMNVKEAAARLVKIASNRTSLKKK